MIRYTPPFDLSPSALSENDTLHLAYHAILPNLVSNIYLFVYNFTAFKILNFPFFLQTYAASYI